MGFVRQHSLIILASITLLVGNLGCAARVVAPPSEQIRAQLGTIGVVLAVVTPEVDYRTPPKGRFGGAATGAGRGLGVGLVGAIGCFLSVGHWAEGCMTALTTPVRIVSGAVQGAGEGLPAAEVEEGETALKTAMAELKVQEAVRDQIIQLAREQTHHHIVLLPEQDPASPGKEVSYGGLANQGIDSVLEIALLNLGLENVSPPQVFHPPNDESLLGADYSVAGAVNPARTFVMTVRTRLIRVVDGKELYVLTSTHDGLTLTFTEWTANEAQSFREEVTRANEILAREIVAKLFL